MKKTSLSMPALAALMGAAIFATASVAAQAPPPAQSPAGGPPPQHRPDPPPTNLKVLPKDLTGEQVHEIMHKWEADLGSNCSTCHTADPKNIGPNGRARLNFADDSKPEKATARLMYKMMEDINKSYISKIDSSGAPVTCGTCHRGHLGPEPFVAAPDHDHDGPLPAGQKPPMPH